MDKKKLINDIVDWIIEKGTKETKNGNYIIYYGDICNCFPEIDGEWLRYNHYNVINEINSRDEISGETYDMEDLNGNTSGFNMDFHPSACEHKWDN